MYYILKKTFEFEAHDYKSNAQLFKIKPYSIIAGKSGFFRRKLKKIRLLFSQVSSDFRLF